MKSYARIKTCDEIRQQCAALGLHLDTRKYDQGDDYIKFHFVHDGITVRVLYSCFNGRFHGMTDDGAYFSSDMTMGGCAWFDALLDFVYSDDPAPAPTESVEEAA